MTTPVYADFELRWGIPMHSVDADFGLAWNVLAPTNQVQLNEGLLLDVDEALKQKLSNLLVTDQAATEGKRSVKVFYRWPTGEVDDQTFPFITITLLRFERASDREQRANYPSIPYVPKGFSADPGYDPNNDPDFNGPMYLQRSRDMSIPLNFIHQIAVHSRFNLHDQEISFQLLMDQYLPPRGAYLVVGDTVRQMFVTGPVDASGMDPQPGGRPKRHFRKVWTTSTSGEMFQKDIEQLYSVATINIDVELVGS